MENPNNSNPGIAHKFLANGGEMGALMRAKNWEETPLGDPGTWPQSLKTTISIILNSKFPKFLFWGPELLGFYNDAYRVILGEDGKHPFILGMPGKMAFKEFWDFIDPLINQVLSGGGATWNEDQPAPVYRNGRVEDVYATYSYSPVTDETGLPAGVLVTVIETTDKVLSKRKTEESERNLRLIIEQAQVAIAIFRGPQYVIEIANKRALELWGRQGKLVTNKPILEIMPELEAQGIKQLLDHVYQTAEPFSATELPVEILRNGQLETAYINFVYEALYDSEGKINGIITIGTEVTASVIARKKIEDSESGFRTMVQKVQELNEELASMNEELSASNEEINAANEELNQSQQSLQALNDDLTENENLLRSLIKQAPVGICLIRAVDLVVMEVNDYYLELVGKKREEIEKLSIWDALPEAAEAYRPIMSEVIKTGVTFTGKEHELILTRNAKPESVVFDFVYEPIKINDHKTDAIMVLAIDVTDKVRARHTAEDMEERIRLAVEAAEIGTFDLDMTKQIMLTSTRFNNIFGFESHVSWEAFKAAVHPDDQETRLAAHEIALLTGKLFYEARVIYPDNSIHWVRAQGQVYFDNSKRPVRMLGTLLDITQFKQLQQQKDDFISIASHELKTPITSLKASLQLLEKVKDRAAPGLLPKLISQSNKSMHKISMLVEDLLNVSRASEKQLKLNKTTFTIAEMLNACCNHIRVAGKYNLTIKGDENLQVYADEHTIDQVMVNLVNNAVKYAPDSLEIILTIEKEANMAKIAVTDFGPGISADKLPRLFERYYQGDASGFQNSGLGLGLYISAEIIKRHGGQIGIISELGKGSTFWFTLPLKS